MSTNKPRPPASAQPPSAHTGLKTTAPKTVAAGIPSVLSTLRQLRAETGFIRGYKLLAKLNQKNGFDCPGCAWPDPDDKRSRVEFCENGTKAVAEEATTKKLTPDFFQKHSVQELAGWSDLQIGKSGRLLQPMVLNSGSDFYEPISWDDAFTMIANELNGLASPNEALFYTSGRTSNEAAYMYQLFVRQFGTNNLPDCSNMCHESSGTALSETLGIGKGSVTLDDFYKTDLIFILGQNPGTNHPRMLLALQQAKRNGAKIITANPIPEAGLDKFRNPQEIGGMLGLATTRLTDLYLPVRINGDVALLKGIMKLLLEDEANIDHDFIQSKTEGYATFKSKMEAVRISDCVGQSGISEKQMRETVELIKASASMICCWAMGLTQHKNAVANIQEIVNLLLLRGNVGRPGAGTCPVRGHSNVQGDRTVGIWEIAKPEFMDALKKEFDFEPPRDKGFDVVEAIKAMADGRAKVFVGMGGNFLSATPDTEFTAQALRKCTLTVQVSTKLNRSHLVTGQKALILPCLGRTEVDEQASGPQFVSIENSMGVVHQSQGNMPPASEHLKSEPAIVAGLAAKTLGPKSKADWLGMAANYDMVRQHIDNTIPGFEQYNERVRKPGGFYLPNGARDGNFETDTGKAKFTVHNLPEAIIKGDEYLMMTIRSHDQYNTTIYGLDDRYRGIYNERRVVMMNEEDMKADGLNKGDVVNLIGEFEGEKRIAEKFIVVPYQIPTRCIATYFPEANVLVPLNHVALRSNTPASKSVVVKVKKT